MPMTLEIKQQQLGAFLKLRCLISIQGEENEIISEEFIVNDIAKMRLKFTTKDSKSGLIPAYIVGKYFAEDFTVKVKVSCIETDKPVYKQLICLSGIEYTQPIYRKTLCDVSLNEMRTCLLNITVSASKIQQQNHMLKNLYNDVDFTDFHLNSANGSVAVHRAHLAAHSDVFKSMLRQEWKEAKEGKVTINGVTLQTLQHLKKYMYLGTLPDDDDEDEDVLCPLLLIASYYLIDELKEECVSKLALTATTENWYKRFEFAIENNIPELVCAIISANPQSLFEGFSQTKVKEPIS